MEADGFQADTEDDDEEDCVIISTQNGESTFNVNPKIQITYHFCNIMIFNMYAWAHIC